LSGFVLYPLFASKANAIIPFGAVVLGLVLYTLFHPGLRKNAPPVEGGAGAASEERAPVPDDQGGNGNGASPDRAAGPIGRPDNHPGFERPNERAAAPNGGSDAYGVRVAAPGVVPESVADSN
jgi:hypothetical protein